MHKLGERTGTPFQVRRLLCLAAENHDRARPEVFHLVNAQLVNLGTIKTRRESGLMYWDLVVTLYCAVLVIAAPARTRQHRLDGFAAVANA